jgi:hypothetical protein
MPVDTPQYRFHNPKMAEKASKEKHKSLERALEEAVSRALRDNLAPLQRTADELHQAFGDLVASCSSTRPSNALPAMLRVQTAASALAAGLSVLSNFVAIALNPREQSASAAAVEEEEEEAARPAARHVHEEVAEPESEWAEATPATAAEPAPPRAADVTAVIAHAAAEVEAEEAAVAPTAVFDIAALPQEVQDMHRRANRVAKVAMQDIKLLRPKDVKLGLEHKDICQRLRSDLDKARKEYDRRFRAILEQPVDYFHHWMVAILADGDSAALGEYPYPSPVLRH